MRTPIRLPVAARNPLSLLGMAVATAMAVLFVVLVAVELLGWLTNPYAGLLVFVAVPVLFVGGLLLIPLGAWWTKRRHAGAAGTTPDWPVIDLRNAHTRNVLVGILVLTIVNVVIVSMAAFGAVHHMETAEFCGQTCHTTMEPQAVAHRAWPHAQVACTQCHIGPGAGAFVEAKLAGTRQLIQVATNNVPKPVPSPQQLISPATATCAGCHSGILPATDVIRMVRDYADDDANSETVTTLRLHVGGETGSHRHNRLEIDFPAAEKASETIGYVRARYPDGTVREFKTEAGAAQGALHRMDCTDCHNRPAHTFSFTPQRAVDRAIAQGAIPRDLPFARREAVAAVAADYADREAALAAIGRRLTDFYAARPGTDGRLVQRAIDGTRNVWARNVFPAMNVKWGTYPNQLGHVDTPGCFRCHDDGHTAADGTVISQDCELCHAIE